MVDARTDLVNPFQLRSPLCDVSVRESYSHQYGRSPKRIVEPLIAQSRRDPNTLFQLRIIGKSLPESFLIDVEDLGVDERIVNNMYVYRVGAQISHPPRFADQ